MEGIEAYNFAANTCCKNTWEGTESADFIIKYLLGREQKIVSVEKNWYIFMQFNGKKEDWDCLKFVRYPQPIESIFCIKNTFYRQESSESVRNQTNKH